MRYGIGRVHDTRDHRWAARNNGPFWCEYPPNDWKEMAIKKTLRNISEVVKEHKFPQKLADWAIKNATPHEHCSGKGCPYCSQMGIVVNGGAPKGVTPYMINEYLQRIKDLELLQADLADKEKALPKEQVVNIDLDKLPATDGQPKPGSAQPVYRDKVAGYWMLLDGAWKRVARPAVPKSVKITPDKKLVDEVAALRRKIIKTKRAITTFENKLK